MIHLKGPAMQATLETRALGETIGSTVIVPKDELLSGRHSAAIRDLLVARGVLRFPDVRLSDEEQLQFAGTIGPVVFDWDVSADKSVNGNAVMAEYQRSSINWHFDGFGVDVPELATLMSPRLLAGDGSSATEFADCHAAYDALPDAEKAALDALQVWHSFETTMRKVKPEPAPEELEAWRKGGPPHLQPLVWHHATGRNSLLLGSSAFAVEGMNDQEGRELIERINAWITRPHNVFRYDWELGDLVIWNNTGLLHRAVPYGLDSKRLMHRTTIGGIERPG